MVLEQNLKPNFIYIPRKYISIQGEKGVIIHLVEKIKDNKGKLIDVSFFLILFLLFSFIISQTHLSITKL